MGPTELLRQQHRDVEALFDRMRGARRDEKVRLLGKLAEDLTLHAALEERIFYPAARRIRELEGALEHSGQEHARMRRLVAGLLALKQTDPALDAVIADLERNVRAHVAEEEGYLLPKVDAQLGEAALAEVAREMERATPELQAQDLLEEAEALETPTV